MSRISGSPRYAFLLWIAGLVVVAGVWFAAQAWSDGRQRIAVARALTRGEPSRALPIMRRFGCAGCHTIPGVPGADGQVGGSLADLRKRVYIAGAVNNSADNLVRWIVSPQAFAPHTAMPAPGLSEQEARDVAAYLYAR